MEKRNKADGLRASYDRLAGEYAKHLFDELSHKPLDRQLLARFAQETRGLGPVCDLGCGPGHVTRYLRSLGAEAFGVDLSAGMVEQAGRLNPGIEFREGDMRSLDAEDGSWGGSSRSTPSSTSRTRRCRAPSGNCGASSGRAACSCSPSTSATRSGTSTSCGAKRYP